MAETTRLATRTSTDGTRYFKSLGSSVARQVREVLDGHGEFVADERRFLVQQECDHAVLDDLEKSSWLTMREIVMRIEMGEGRLLDVLNAVASALADAEPDGWLDVDRSRRPYRYRIKKRG